MVSFKIVIADTKTGKSYQREADDSASQSFLGLKIGEKVRGEVIDLTGYEFLITGGSDRSGFPMRADLPGTARKKILAVSGIGLRKKKKRKGVRQRKTVRGNTISDSIAQINLKITTYGRESLEPKDSSKESERKEREEKPKEEKKESAKEEKKEEKREGTKPVEQKKETEHKDDKKEEEKKQKNKEKRE